ncbi:hypothetical protein [Nitrobacter sp.]|uniref:hypothetical protein n=1 Tax=Nitrobacter sp. TaxID=29420 RepID=UPI003F64CAAE
MALTPERKAELHAEIDALLAQFEPPPPKPKPAVAVVASEGRVIRDADVVVSPRDPNAENGKPRTVSVRAETVQINMAVAESQYWQGLRDREADRRQRRMLDPCGLGIWGGFDDE